MITIPNPCSENWGKMSKTEKGRFCNSCNKQVIDFSKMKNDKIKTYFGNNQTDEICGNFKTSQVNQKIISRSRFKFVAMFVVFLSFVQISCRTKMKGLVRKIDTNEKDTIHTKPFRLLGKPSYRKPFEKNEIITDTIKK